MDKPDALSHSRCRERRLNNSNSSSSSNNNNNYTAEDHPWSFDAPQQHVYTGLACPADYSISAQEWTRHLQVSPRSRRNGLACTDSMLAYGHHAWHNWPTAAALQASYVGTGRTLGQRDRQGENIMPPLQAMTCIGYRGIIINELEGHLVERMYLRQSCSHGSR